MKKLIGGGICIFIGSFMFLGFAANLSGSGFAIEFVDIVVLLLFVLAPIAVGGFMIRSHLTDKQSTLQQKLTSLQKRREKQILQLALKKDGRLTIPEIAANTSMSTTEAEEFMRDMTAKGYVDMQVTDSGVIMYEFYEIIHRESLDE
jgi:hypothetical protein